MKIKETVFEETPKDGATGDSGRAESGFPADSHPVEADPKADCHTVDPEAVSLAGDLTLAGDPRFADEPDVQERVDLLRAAGDIPDTRISLREMIKSTSGHDPLTGSSGTFRTPDQIIRNFACTLPEGDELRKEDIVCDGGKNHPHSQGFTALFTDLAYIYNREALGDTEEEQDAFHSRYAGINGRNGLG